MTATLVWGAATAFVVGVALQPVVLRLMRVAEVLDVPCERSAHCTPTPRGGGLAVVTAATAGLFVGHLWGQPVAVLVWPMLLFAAIGLLDDIRGLSIRTRVISQLGAGAVGAVLLVTPGPQPPIPVAWSAGLLVLVTFWLAACVNAYNFMDGVNGISAVHAVLAGSVYLIVGVEHQLSVLALGGAGAAAAAVTFLPWNFGRARIFLGDVGSYGLGGLLGALAAYATSRGVPLLVSVAPVALYLTDTGWTLLRRCCRGEAWFRAHRTHVYQRLTDAGFSHQQVTTVTALISATVCGCLLAGARADGAVRAALLATAAAGLAGYLLLPRLWEHRTVRQAPAYRGRVHV